MQMQDAEVKKTRKSTAKRKQPENEAGSSPERLQMIAEAAYFHAQQRGFEAGNDLEDWLRAERDIGQTMS